VARPRNEGGRLGRVPDDEEWKGVKRVTRARHGDLVGEIEDRLLEATPYTPSR